MNQGSQIRQAGRSVLQRAVLTAGALQAWWVALAHAQKETGPPEESKPIIQWVCVVIFAGLCIAIAFKNPKRTHLG